MNQPRPGQAPDTAWQIQTLADSAKRLAERGEKREAERVYLQILEAAPYHVRALNFLAVQAMLRGEIDLSEEYLERALRAAPDRPILHKNIAVVFQARGDLEKALAALDRAVELKPEMNASHLHRGDVLESLGRHDEAVMSYWQAWRGFPDPEALLVEELVPPALRGLLQRAGQSLREAQGQLMQEQLGPLRERHSTEALTRIDQAVDIYLGLKRNPYPHALQRPALLYLPGIAPRSFFEREEFAWVPALEAATAEIRKEFDSAFASDTGLAPYVQVGPGMDPQQWRELDGSRAWSALHLIKGGTADALNPGRCPETMLALSAVPLADIPGHAPEAFFSILEPNTHIPSHFGLGNYKLATHLPLMVPKDCAIRVGNDTRAWTEGECLIFDDSFQHEAWNRSTERRAVLIFDVWHPEVTLAEREGITALTRAIDAFNRKYRPAA